MGEKKGTVAPAKQSEKRKQDIALADILPFTRKFSCNQIKVTSGLKFLNSQMSRLRFCSITEFCRLFWGNLYL